ncbi:TspO/MBR family protein [Lacimicrobium alkaliphilum]|uniref:Tryptophan-rich sensory protein n=1 Tax=Lacimicrobium alkaliphilum TaxID=1526571 RepID=A0ABQ1RJR1_9ALTE|nr:TspO/MBR family protein [Lacimicrobium alkaliphilum]GGD69330.1 tryptophan-rich sensory protein [Lacimicrobium alkaliphilum]
MPQPSLLRQSLMLIFFLLVTYIVAAIGSIASIDAPDFYLQLTQPVWAPPAWLFGPVWTLLYTLMAIAAWLVWRSRCSQKQAALGLYALQLVLNGLWSWLFFTWALGAIAFAEILLLWGLILLTMINFWRCNKIAGTLLLPYWLWVSFAAVLNWALWLDNPALL